MALAAAANIGWLVEKLPHVGAVYVYARLPAAANGQRRCAVRVGARAVQFDGVRVDLGCAAVPADDCVSFDGDHCVVKLALAPVDKVAAARPRTAADELSLVSSSLEDVGFPLSCELQPANLRSILCRRCGAAVVRRHRDPMQDEDGEFVEVGGDGDGGGGGHGLRVLPLPSPYWSELADLWFCHNKQSVPFSLEADTVRASAGRILVGCNHLLVHSSVLAAAPVPFADEVLARPLRCGCGALLGDEHRNGDVQLYKYAISSAAPRQDKGKREQGEEEEEEEEEEDKDGGDAMSDVETTVAHSELQQERGAAPAAALPDVFSLYTLENFFASQVLAVTHARAMYRFVLRDPGASVVVHLLLLNWDTHIRSNEGPGPIPVGAGVGGEPITAPALKLLFRVVVDGAEKDRGPGEGEAEPQPQPQPRDVITHTTPNCRALLALLRRRSDALIPPSQRRWRGHRLSFVRRLAHTL